MYTCWRPLLIHEYKSHRRPAPSELNPGKPKYKPYGKIKDDIGLGAPEEGRSKCDLNLKPGVSKTTLKMIKERLLMSHIKNLAAASDTNSHYCEI